ncbi:MAG: AAA family ATPase [Thermoplasmata archaeon]
MPDGDRRLSAVMLTDLVGYTALTQRDEAAALRLLEEHRQIVRPLLRDHFGREVKTIGDAFLVEFANALDATRCAEAIQKSLHARNTRTPSGKIELRIGLHVGDVEHQNGDIYGDAVNIVSRVEPMAEPGGICVSGDVYNQVRNKIALAFEPLGTPSLKNIEFPVALYRVELPWMVTSLSPKTPWVARPEEQEHLRKAVERAVKGEGSALVLVGESGVGKTRLAEEAIRSAEQAGVRALRGRAFPGEGALPYSHWVEMIQTFLRDAPLPLVQRVGWAVAGEVSKIVPELADKVGSIPPSPASDPEAARARFYEGVSQFFVNLSQETPLLLLFEDLQWADPASLSLFEYAIRSVARHRLFLLGTSHELDAEENPRVAGVLRYLEKNHLLANMAIRRLNRASVGAMIQRTFGETEPISDEFASLIHERTGGNPYFVEEVLRSLVEEGAIYRTDEGRWERKEVGQIAIPRTVRDVVKQRFNRLDEPTQSTLRVAAVLGVEFPVDLLRDVSGMDEERLLEQLERMVRAGVLEETKSPTHLQSLSFADPQLQRVLYEEILSMRRVRYHRKAGQVLEGIAGTRREEFAGDLAYHYREGHDHLKAREYSVLAAGRWAKLYGFDEAERQYRTALELLEEAPDDGVRARVLDGLGRTQFALGRTERAVGEWEAAIRLYEATGDALKAGSLCHQLADRIRLNPGLAAGQPHRVEELLEAGRRLLESIPPSRELVLLYGLWSIRLGEQGRRAEGRSMAEKAIEVAQAIGDRDAEMMSYDELAMTVPLGEKEKVFEYLEAKEKYFSQPGREDWEQVFMARNNLSVASLWVASDAPSALRWAESAAEATQQIRNRTDEAYVRLSRTVLALLWIGDVPRAEQELARVRELLDLPADSRNFNFEIRSAELALLRGDLDQAARHLSRTEANPQGYANFATRAIPLSELHRQRGELSEAAAVLKQAIAAEVSPLTDLSALRGRIPLGIRAALAETLLEGSREPTATEDVARLASELHQVATILRNPFVLGLDQRVQGELARRQGRTADAVVRLEEAVEWFRKSGNVAELARTLVRLGDASREAGQGERTERFQQEAREITARLRGTSP